MEKNSILKLYQKLSLIRKVEERIATEYSRQLIRCPVHLSIGQEGVAVGVISALNKEDIVMSNHRSHAHYLAKNCDISSFINELYGTDLGCSRGFGGSMHLVDLKNNFYGSTPIVGSTIPISAGISFADKLLNNKNYNVVFLGEGATETGNFHEVLNFASLNKLKIIFVCENNLYSVYTHISERQSNYFKKIKILCSAHNIDYFHVKGHETDKIYTLTKKIRNTKFKNPILIEADTYRFLEHCGPNNDDDLRYRSKNEINKFKKCPMVYLQKKYKYLNSKFQSIDDFNLKKVEKIFKLKRIKNENNSSLTKFIYA